MLMDGKKLPKIDDERDPMVRRDTLELVRAYYRIPDPAVRRRNRFACHSFPSLLALVV
jgi:hypothetical protein